MMEHKAFLLDFEQFELELLPALAYGLKFGDCEKLHQFVNTNLMLLKDPYEGQDLSPTWESLLTTRDAHELGDVALTKYYDPAQDIGLGASWIAVQDLVEGDRATSPILGAVVGESSNLFDPGKMGSYFQKSQDAVENLAYLRDQVTRHRPQSNEIEQAIQMLEQAVAAKQGLYITF